MMENPNKHGVVIVETTGKNKETQCYPGPTRNGMSRPYKVSAGIFKNGFNPKKVVFLGEEVTIYAKNMTLKFDDQGNVTTLPVKTWKE